MYAVVHVKNGSDQGEEPALRKDKSGGRGVNGSESGGLSAKPFGCKIRMREERQVLGVKGFGSGVIGRVVRCYHLGLEVI